MTLTLHLGDCLDVLRTLPDASVDAVVTDPPYGLAFMGKRWDYDVPTTEVWAECLRVLKPGGHLLAFAGTRTQHRMAVRIEDAGFEIRDMITWVYGSGFPKSLDVSKAIDKAAGAEREVVGLIPDRWTGKGNALNFSTDRPQSEVAVTGAPATPEAQQWSGWGTALKPALEPITMARKPLEGTVAANVLAHGTGGLNVDGCRVGTEDMSGQWDREWNDNSGEFGSRYPQAGRVAGKTVPPGRWPANLIHDGSDEVVGLFPQTVGKIGIIGNTGGNNRIYGKLGRQEDRQPGTTDTGSAARFFYTAKASRDDRSDGNTHPTVKPTDLMRYLCRLVTPPGGVVLDPFMGSGSTGKAAMLEGFGFIGIEREAQYHAIAERRIHQAGAAGHQPDLFSSGLAA
jgi:site-specific DNA-methyltransferase (adenine-specific)